VQNRGADQGETKQSVPRDEPFSHLSAPIPVAEKGKTAATIAGAVWIAAL
jgi:hypothetical protein